MTAVKALVNEDTLLRTHCCPWCFLGCANWETFVADTKCFWTKSETFFCVRNKCCARGQTRKHLCRQQCVSNNVSSFARALSINQCQLWPKIRRLIAGYTLKVLSNLKPRLFVAAWNRVRSGHVIKWFLVSLFLECCIASLQYAKTIATFYFEN